jgi:16S rRNA (adenine1518-N6/adenine1519-N6)-dimethyltransferase
LLEIGPGGGALTKYLLEEENIVYKAIEIDDEKVAYLKHHYPAIKEKIVHVDILKAIVPFDETFSVIGNFPYNISSPILFKILDWEPQVTEVIGMFQKEVAQRIAEPPGSKLYGILSVLMQAFFKVEYLFDVHENCFTPPPKVKSGVVRFTNLQNPFHIVEKKKFIQLIKAAFNQRRKTLRNAWRGTLPPEMLQLEIMNKRAEQLTVTEFVSIYNQWQVQ